MKHFYASLLAVLTLTPAMAIDLPSEPPVIVNFATWSENDFKKNFVVRNANEDPSQFFWQTAGGESQRASNTVVLYYSIQADANDWVITSKPVNLIAGLKYKLTAKASAYNLAATYTETVGMYVGTEPTVSAMTQEVIAPTLLSTKFDQVKSITNEFTVSTSGEYYIGFVCKTPKNGGFWCAYHGFELIAQGSKGQPATPDAPTVVADKSGKTEVSIKAVAPAVDVTGSSLTNITSLRIYRDGERIAEWSNVTPGSTTAEFIDNETHNLTPGAHTYRIDAVAPEATSEISASSTVYVGINEPGNPTNATVRPGSKDGEVVITWDAPAFDKDGYVQNGDVTYTVYAYPEGEPLADNLTATTFTYEAAKATDVQKLFSFRIYAKTSKGRSPRASQTDYVPAGKSLTTPYAESFAGGEAKDVFDFVSTGSGQFKFYSSNYESQDGDKGVAAFTGKSENDAAELRSAIIEVPANCSLTFFFSGLNAGNNNRLNLLIDGGNGFENVATYSLISGSWAMGNFDLKNYAGKKIRYGFRATYVNNGVVLIDNVRIAPRDDKDVAITSCSIPERVKVATDTKVSANISNLGSEKADNVVVNLLVNGNVTDTKTVSINAGKETTVELNLNLSVLNGTSANVSVEANYDGDTNTANNAIGPRVVELILPNLPAVTDLTGEQDHANVQLNWTRPGFEGIEVDQMTESFENADAWSSDVENWTIKYDHTSPRMSCTVSGSHVFPGIHGKTGGFFVLDGTGLSSNYEAFEGKQMLCSAPTADGSERVDWLISPELDGSEQQISIAARSVGEAPALQIYEIDPETNEYTFIQTNYVPTRWVTVKFFINEGVKNFALCCKSSLSSELLIDNVTFRPNASVAGMEIAGYNVYCDNDKLNTELITTESFTHRNVAAGVHNYVVTCVSNKGVESAISNTVSINMDPSGLDAVNAASAVTVAVRDRAIIVNAPADARVQVVAMDGRVVYAGEGNSVVNVAPGVYAISAAGNVAKVIVR